MINPLGEAIDQIISVFQWKKATLPANVPTDECQVYAADESAGNTCLHIKTENGKVIKLFQATALTAVDAAAIDGTYDSVEQGVLNNVRTRLNEVETLLKANGLVA